MEKEIIQTADGSHSIYIKELDEHYHSIHGAIQESKHVFINAGLNFGINEQKKKSVNIFEVGFGTGLNAFLTLLQAEQNNIPIQYTSIEFYPLNAEFYEKLNYTESLSEKGMQDLFLKLHQAEWEKEIEISHAFTLHKLHESIQEYSTPEKFDVIYFDAFGPRAQSEMWTKQIFEKMFSILATDGILVTYCAKGEVKRILKSVGFKVESLQGPPGKREMIRAMKGV